MYCRRSPLKCLVELLSGAAGIQLPEDPFTRTRPQFIPQGAEGQIVAAYKIRDSLGEAGLEQPQAVVRMRGVFEFVRGGCAAEVVFNGPPALHVVDGHPLNQV